MKRTIIFAVAAVLAACTKSGEQQPVSTMPAVAQERSSEALQPSSPLIAAATECLTRCTTVYSSNPANPDRRVYYGSRLPNQFNDWARAHRDSLTLAVASLPTKLTPLWIGQPDDDPEFQMRHSLIATVVDLDGSRIYLYRDVGFNRRELHSLMHFAIDEATHEAAAIVTANTNQDGYFLSGPKRLQAVLLADLAVKEMVDARASLERVRNGGDWVPSQAYEFPLNMQLRGAAQDRLAHFNAVLTGDHMRAVQQPPDKLEEQRILKAAAWYAVSTNEVECIWTSDSPAKRIQFIREAGIQPKVSETVDATGNLRIVEVSATDGGYITTWRYFKHESECAATLPINGAPIPDRYR